MTPAPLFDEIAAKPVFSLTADQDWAPDWALAQTLELVAKANVPLHLFATNASPSLRSGNQPGLTFGIHPNFLPGSTHGAGTDEIIESCLAVVPDATTFRSHGFFDNTPVLRNLAARGFTADSNVLTFLQPGLVPIVLGTGLLRFPVFFEDDVFLDLGGPDLDLTQCLDLLASPGLKIFNVHPSLVALNVPSVQYYDERRPVLYGSSGKPEYHGGRGVATLLSELVSAVRESGFDFTPFPELVAAAYSSLRTAFPDGLYGWPGVRSGGA
jgi:hypothetical protein